MAPLEKLTVARLDELASEQNLTDYPADANKPDKIAFLAAALGADYQEEDRPGFVVSVLGDVNSVQFQAGTQHVDLQAGDTFETTDPLLAASLRDHPFLTVKEA